MGDNIVGVMSSVPPFTVRDLLFKFYDIEEERLAEHRASPAALHCIKVSQVPSPLSPRCDDYQCPGTSALPPPGSGMESTRPWILVW